MTRDYLIMLDLPMAIETLRLHLRPPQTGDGKALHGAMLDGYDDFVKWLQLPTTSPTVEFCERECRKHQASWILRTDLRFLCFRKDTGELIGRLAFPDFQCVWATPLLAISYFIGKSHQGQGFVTEAVNALARYSLQCFSAKKLEIKCDVDNVAGCRVPEKLGFIEEGVQKGIWPKPGDPLASIRIYACFDESTLPSLDITMAA